ncbi:MAG: glycosyltransferase family 4 protein [Planctomycetes bacterium]|nr:glycosyltransferase family 4 protein [Planctomycetota bacterium]
MAPRVLIIARQFWPGFCEHDSGLVEIAAGLAEAGSPTTVLTPRWFPELPAETNHRGLRILRLPPPSGRGWGRDPFVRATAGWLKTSAGELDLAYVSGLRYDAEAALIASSDGRLFPVLLRPAATGLKGDVYWQLEASGGRRVKARCQRAAGFVASNRAIEREVIAAGFPRGRIHYIADGVANMPERNARTQADARQALAAAQPSLGHSGPVAVYVGGLAEEGPSQLAAGWAEIVLRWPDARLWLVGSGPGRIELLRMIDELGLTRHVVLSGTFDTLDEVLTAADVFVSPVATSSAYAVLQAMAAGVPVVAPKSSVMESIITDCQHGLLVPPEEPRALIAAIATLFGQPELAGRLAAAARERAAQQFSLAETVRRHQALFGRVLAERAADFREKRLSTR